MASPIDLEGPAPPYADPLEHLCDELRWLDLVLHAAILRQHKPRPENPLEALMGLVVSDEEIEALLARDGEETGGSAAARRLLDQARLLRDHIDSRRQASADMATALPLDEIGRIFGLSATEAHCLLICLAPEIDRKYGKLFAYLQDDVTRKRPSLDLVGTLLGDGPRARLHLRQLVAPDAPLLRHRLVVPIAETQDDAAPLLLRDLRIDERLVGYACGERALDPRLAPLSTPGQGEERAATAHPELVQRLRAYLRSEAGPSGAHLVLYLHGARGSGRRSLAAVAAHSLGRSPLWVDGERLLNPSRAADCALLLVRESVLQGALLCVAQGDAFFGTDERARATLAALVEAFRLYRTSAVLIGENAWRPRERLGDARFLAIAVEHPGAGERLQLWHQMTGDELGPGADVLPLASTFRFTPGQIAEVLAEARQRARWRDPESRVLKQDDVLAACRALSAPDLFRLAVKIEPTYGWADIVLPAATLEQLQELCAQARHRPTVMGAWGFDAKLSHGKGIAALFSGPPGTGKTMAAEVIAGELGADLYKIDLSQVISKWIGETEKNLDRVFAAAQHSNAILFFDEADALFGKRAEVKDSHDRYANVEISYLLQRMEEYDGLAILTTNMRQHLDEAFLRRLRAIVEFPFPDAELRNGIWNVIFPAATPLAEDVDLARLARDIRLAGGGIKNIALNAAALAAHDGSAVAMRHLIRAAQREHEKVGRKWGAGVSLVEAAS